jgi:hypothetical protein
VTRTKKNTFLICSCGAVTMVLFDGRCLSCARNYVASLEVAELSALFQRSTKVTWAEDDGA